MGAKSVIHKEASCTPRPQAFALGLHSSPHSLMMIPFPFFSPLTPPSSASLNATASFVPVALNSRAEIGDGYLGNWRRRFLARGVPDGDGAVAAAGCEGAVAEGGKGKVEEGGEGVRSVVGKEGEWVGRTWR